MITLIKTTAGTEIAGEVIHEDENVIVLQKPLQINYRYFVGALPTVSVNRYMLFSENDVVEINKSHVVAQSVARKAFEHFYMRSVDQHYKIAQQSIDNELTSMEEDRSFVSKEEYHEHLKKLLEEMPVDGSTVN